MLGFPFNGSSISGPQASSSPHLPCSLSTPSTSIPTRNHPTLPRTKPTNTRAELRIRCSRRRSGPYSDPNAETIRTGKFRFQDEPTDDEDRDGYGRRGSRNWWSDDSSDFDEDEDPFEEDPWDRIWIVKVFKSYGWFFPAIVLSLLLANGPKAFLMALALPLGQSVISLAMDKVRRNSPNGPKPKSRTRKWPFSRNFQREEEEEEEEISYDNMGRSTYQSWVATEDGVAEKDDKQRGQQGSSFGGWDELEKDRRGGLKKGATRQSPPMADGQRRQRLGKKGKLSRRQRSRDMPLFLRLLVAVFPFLGSWMKLL